MIAIPALNQALALVVVEATGGLGFGGGCGVPMAAFARGRDEVFALLRHASETALEQRVLPAIAIDARHEHAVARARRAWRVRDRGDAGDRHWSTMRCDDYDAISRRPVARR